MIVGFVKRVIYYCFVSISPTSFLGRVWKSAAKVLLFYELCNTKNYFLPNSYYFSLFCKVEF
ncbi:MAG: hypothetical protein ACI4TV_02385, partial [Paludibacteraceae bacterium]